MSRVTLHVWEPDPGEGEICDKPGMKTMRRTMEHILLYTQKKTSLDMESLLHNNKTIYRLAIVIILVFIETLYLQKI